MQPGNISKMKLKVINRIKVKSYFIRLLPQVMKSWLLAIFFISYIHNSVNAQQNISNYKIYYGIGKTDNKDVIIIRQYPQEGQQFYIGVDPNNLQTRAISSESIVVKPFTWQQIQDIYSNTPYLKAVLEARKQSFFLQNAGIIHGYPKEKGVTLTIDLCPSHKPLDRLIFTSLLNEFQKTEKPVPIALSITGRFMLTHPSDIIWLKSLIDSGQISVTWIDHTFNHHYNPKTPLKENFLLEPNTDLNFEILGTEIALLQKGFVFSVFFRFPGLVSDPQVVKIVTDYGLIPIGSDAWLAKGQPAYSGSIVLIHGNGNEPLGIKDFIRLLQTEKSSVESKEWLLYDLRESIEDEFQ